MSLALNDIPSQSIQPDIPSENTTDNEEVGILQDEVEESGRLQGDEEVREKEITNVLEEENNVEQYVNRPTEQEIREQLQKQIRDLLQQPAASQPLAQLTPHPAQLDQTDRTEPIPTQQSVALQASITPNQVLSEQQIKQQLQAQMQGMLRAHMNQPTARTQPQIPLTEEVAEPIITGLHSPRADETSPIALGLDEHLIVNLVPDEKDEQQKIDIRENQQRVRPHN